jgi:hypothetical protein
MQSSAKNLFTVVFAISKNSFGRLGWSTPLHFSTARFVSKVFGVTIGGRSMIDRLGGD